MALLDKLIGTISPKREARRERHRAVAAAWRQTRMHYEGATFGPRAYGWQVVSTDANAVSLSARSRLRDVARDLIRNNATANRAVSLIANNVVGPGIIPTVTTSNEQDRVELEQLIRDHLETTDIDAAQKQDLYGLQNIVMRAIVTDGEVLIRRRRRLSRDGFALPFQLQVLEADYLNTAITGIGATAAVGPSNPNNTVIQGVEFDPIGRIVGYWLFDQHPGSIIPLGQFNFTSHFVPASEIAHVFLTMRPGEIRGVSWFAPVILRMKDLADFKEAHLMRQKIAACFAAFITTEDSFQGDELAPAAEAGAPPFESIEPGMIERLYPGQDVKFGSPPPVVDFDPYVKSLDREIAIGMGVSYEALTGDLSNVNFSSGRMGWLEFMRNIQAWRDYMLTPQMLAPVAQWFLDAAPLALGRKLADDVRIKWTPPRREMISPTDEVTASRNAIRAGLTSRSEEVRKLGFDPLELDAEVASDNERADKLGIIYDSDPRKTSAAGLEQPSTAGETIQPAPKKVPTKKVGG